MPSEDGYSSDGLHWHSSSVGVEGGGGSPADSLTESEVTALQDFIQQLQGWELIELRDLLFERQDARQRELDESSRIVPTTEAPAPRSRTRRFLPKRD